ncbi:putative purine permease 4 [Zostera marina]|uniref:Probable purine permease n=1 Tax=Zostera marina TaxID=29655 RepID=A0A0K9PA49_ZOSMR|nr:putative purine permease 4 [Zostera marina]
MDRQPSNSITAVTGGEIRDPSKWVLKTINYVVMIVGSVSSSLITRFYFNHHGSSRWLSTTVQSIGFPLLLFPIFLSGNRSSSSSPPAFSLFTPKMITLCIIIGLFLGVNNFLFSLGISYLPMSTNGVLLSTQVGFNLLTSVVMVKQKVRLNNLNCVVLLTLSSVLIAVGSNSDMPKGVSRVEFFIGFFSALGAAGMFALYLPIMEIVLRQVHTYRMVMEMQVIMEASATVFSLVGMACSHGFGEMMRESSSEFDLGKSKYWWTIVATIVLWQFCFMSTAGLVFLTSALNSGICMTATMVLHVVAGVLCYGDHLDGAKVVSTLMSTWALLTYFYREYRRQKKEPSPDRQEKEMVGVGEV